jgi:hypothetical protein
MRMAGRALRFVTVAALLGGCANIHHVRDTAPETAAPTADAAQASTNCFEASTSAERAACASPALSALYRAMVEMLQAKLSTADFAGRDVLLAMQRRFLLGLPAACPVGGDTCLGAQFSGQTAALAAWIRIASNVTAVAQYVHFKVAPGAGMNPDFCRDLASGANAVLARLGSVNPANMPGASEIAGTHGPDRATLAGQDVHVMLRLANAFGGFAQRAEGVTIGGATVLDSVSLGNLVQATADNQGGRFSAYASQTGDYGSADVFTFRGRTVALLADAWGFDAPAAAGGFAHAGVWDVGVRPAAPLCLFETFQMPPEGDVDARPEFAAWRAALEAVRQSAAPDLGVRFLRDEGQIRAQTDWTLLHMPLVATAQARGGGWTLWLRLRHDAVLDALFAWAQSGAAHKALFDSVFAHLRPAAQDLVAYYQQTQALSGAEAKEAAGLAVMELLYGATVNIAPDIGVSASFATGKPRYPILASPN